MKWVLEFTDKDGFNCLMISFQPIINYYDETDENPTSSTGMFSEIETTVRYLIEEGDKHGVDMSTILNARNKNGETLFVWATEYSEKIALALLERNVIVNTIDSTFQTPIFKVS